MDKKNANLILDRIPEDEIIHHEENLAMITIKTHKEIVDIAGVF